MGRKTPRSRKVVSTVSQHRQSLLSAAWLEVDAERTHDGGRPHSAAGMKGR